MAEEKKYEITISDLSAYIGAAAFEILPENAKEEDVDKYAMVAAGITDRVAKHLDGSNPLPEDHVALAKEMGQFINELGAVCEKIVQQWKWKKDERTNTYLEEPVPFFDDAMAMLRYSIEEERKAKPKLNRNLKGGL